MWVRVSGGAQSAFPQSGRVSSLPLCRCRLWSVDAALADGCPLPSALCRSSARTPSSHHQLDRQQQTRTADWLSRPSLRLLTLLAVRRRCRHALLIPPPPPDKLTKSTLDERNDNNMKHQRVAPAAATLTHQSSRMGALSAPLFMLTAFRSVMSFIARPLSTDRCPLPSSAHAPSPSPSTLNPSSPSLSSRPPPPSSLPPRRCSRAVTEPAPSLWLLGASGSAASAAVTAPERSWTPPPGACLKAPSSHSGRRRTQPAPAALPLFVQDTGYS